MCTTCGCSGVEAPDHHHHDPHHHHDHGQDGHHPGAPPPAPDGAREARRVRLEEELLQHNALHAERNRSWFAERRLLALNLVSSPGAGKTALLERSIVDQHAKLRFSVVQGDHAGDRDAERIRHAGARAVQLNTGKACHLDAAMVARAAAELDPRPESVLAIENVGNLVCPALFDLGEHVRVVVASVAEGDDKPIKYPYMFRSADLVILNKLDLLPYVSFDRQRFEDGVRTVNDSAEILAVSATRGDGMPALYRYLAQGLETARRSDAGPLPGKPKREPPGRTI